MPQRPRSHVLETESKHALAAAVPTEWVVRPLDEDYGIDRTVEIFIDGKTTGLSFHVQLKATDDVDLDKALRSLRFPVDHAEYYSALQLPVLVVLYHAPSKQLYARWWHAYNPRTASRPDLELTEAKVPPKTVGFVLSEEDVWARDTPTGLVEAIAGFHRFRSPHLLLPVVFEVSASDGAGEAAIDRLIVELRRRLGPLSQDIAVRRGQPSAGSPSIVVHSESSTVALGDVTSITIDDDASSTTEQVAANLGCGVAIVLARVGQMDLAARVAAICLPDAPLMASPYVTGTLGVAFVRSRRVLEALDAIDSLYAQMTDDATLAGFFLHGAVLQHRHAMTEAERIRMIEVAEAAYARHVDGGDSVSAARCACNLARALAWDGAWERAVEMYERALALDPDYERDEWFLHEYASSLFEAHQFDRAIDTARKSQGLEPSSAAEVLIADGLMFAGRYSEAYTAFDDYLRRGADDPADTAWRLKRRALGHICGLVGDSQRREPEQADSFADRVDLSVKDLDVEAAVADVDAAIKCDALCPYAHYLRAFLGARDDGHGGTDLGDVIEPAICAAVLAPEDPDLWVFAIVVSAMNQEADDLIYDLMHYGVFKCSDVLTAKLLELRQPLSPQHTHLLERATKDVLDKRSKVTPMLRARNPGGELEELELDLRPPGFRPSHPVEEDSAAE